jgi:hypothetical protein
MLKNIQKFNLIILKIWGYGEKKCIYLHFDSKNYYTLII